MSSIDYAYDVFISYRKVAPDLIFAEALHHDLVARGFRACIDFHDFQAAQVAISEMERCIRSSRYIVALLSPRYITSGFAIEESIICKQIDLENRRKRLIPVTIESCASPSWLHGIVGVDLSSSENQELQYTKLLNTLRENHPWEEKIDNTTGISSLLGRIRRNRPVFFSALALGGVSATGAAIAATHSDSFAASADVAMHTVDNSTNIATHIAEVASSADVAVDVGSMIGDFFAGLLG